MLNSDKLTERQIRSIIDYKETEAALFEKQRYPKMAAALRQQAQQWRDRLQQFLTPKPTE